MNKLRFTILATIIVFGLYFFRIELVKLILNAALDKHQIQVVHLQGLRLDSESISVNAMDLVVGKNQAKQRFQGLLLNYSMEFPPTINLYIHAASVSIPEFAQTEKSAVPLMLSALLSYLAKPPLRSLKIESIRILGRNVQLGWQRSGHEQELQINDAERESKLSLIYQSNETVCLEWVLQEHGKVIASIDLDLKKNGDNYLLTGAQFVRIAPLLKILKPYIEIWSEHTRKLKGTLAFELQTELENNLQLLAKKLDLRISGKLQIPSSATRDYKIKKLSAKIQGQLSIRKTRVFLKLSPGEILKVTSIDLPALAITNLKVQTKTPSELSFEVLSGNFQLIQKQFHIDLPRVKTSKLKLSTRLELNDVQIHNRGIAHASFQIKTDKVRIEIPRQWIPTVGFHSKIALKNQRLSAHGHLFSETQKKLLDFSALHNLDNNMGTGRISSNLAFDSHNNKISQYFLPWPFPWDLQSGRFHAESNLEWRQINHSFQITATVEQNFNQLSGHYNDIAFRGMDGSFSGKHGPANLLTSTKPGKLSIDTLDIGLPVNDINLSFSIDASRNRLNLHTFGAQLLGGGVRGQNFAFQPEQQNNPLMLNIERIQISELLSLAAFETVHANGEISGKLPISIGSRAISMKQGRLAAEKPGGVIRYLPDSSAEFAAAVNPGLRIAIDALSNYHYETLEADAQYSTNGDLTLQVKMQGLNPDMNNGQRIDLNLNVSDNIPTLLRSLQSSRMITDILEKKLTQ